MNPFYEFLEGNLRIDQVERLDFPEHLHAHTELLFILEGEVRLALDETVYSMKRGDCAVIFPGRIHSYQCDTHNKVWLLIFDTSLSGVFQYSLQNFYPRKPVLESQEVPADVSFSLNRLHAADEASDTLLCSSWIQVILSLLLPSMELSKEERSESENLTYQIVHYMAGHFQEPLSLEHLAHALHINKYYLSHVFSEKLQMSFPQYLNYLRVEHAADAMRHTGKSLTQIWEESGFSSQRSFNRAFHSIKGVSPLAYRKSLRP